MRTIHTILLTSSLVGSVACTPDFGARNITFGEIDATEIDVASRLPGRVKTVLVHLGQQVKAGDVLVEFEDDLMNAKKQAAVAIVAAAESKDAIAQNAVRPEEKEQLRAAVTAARQQMDFAHTTLERTQGLLKDGAVAQQTVDEIKFKFDSATEAFRAADAKLKMATSGARPEEKAATKALVEQAKTALAEIDAYQKDMNLKAPIDGEVFTILNHEGEIVPAAYPVVTLLKMQDIKVTMQIPENSLLRFPKDSKVNITIPAMKDKAFKGTVAYIAPMGAFASHTFTRDRGAFDLKTFEVHVQIENPDKLMRPGMTATVEPVK